MFGRERVVCLKPPIEFIAVGILEKGILQLAAQSLSHYAKPTDSLIYLNKELPNNVISNYWLGSNKHRKEFVTNIQQILKLKVWEIYRAQSCLKSSV